MYSRGWFDLFVGASLSTSEIPSSDVPARACDTCRQKPWKALTVSRFGDACDRQKKIDSGRQRKSKSSADDKFQKKLLKKLPYMEFWVFFFRIEISFQICQQILSPKRVASAKALGLFTACDGLVTKPEPAHH